MILMDSPGNEVRVKKRWEGLASSPFFSPSLPLREVACTF